VRSYYSDVPEQPKELGDMWRQCAEYTFQTVANLRDAYWFREPVDPVLDGCPDYLEVIEEPIHINEVERRFKGRQMYEKEEGYAALCRDLRSDQQGSMEFF
jgi:hypothetical protein